MLTKLHYYYYINTLLVAYSTTQADILMLEKQWLSCPTFTVALYVYFLHKEKHIGLAALFLFSIPCSIIHYHLSGLQLLLYMVLMFLYVLCKNSIRIKQAIPLLLVFSFLLLQEIYFYFFTQHQLVFSRFFMHVATSIAIQYFILYMFDKKKETP